MNPVPVFGSIKTSQAVVRRTTARGIFVQPVEECATSVKGCHGCALCQTTRSGHLFFCAVDSPGSFSPGQCVNITWLALNEAFAAAMLFGVPLFFSGAGYFAATLFFSAGVDSPGAILTTCLCLCAGFAAVYCIEKIIRTVFPVTLHSSTDQ
jgi:hypothetical protein